MSLVWSIAIVVGAASLCGGGDARGTTPSAGGWVRRRWRPRLGVFGVIATGFSVLLGFLIFLAFENHGTEHDPGPRQRQLTVAQQVPDRPAAAGLRPREDLAGELVCYAR